MIFGNRYIVMGGRIAVTLAVAIGLGVMDVRTAAIAVRVRTDFAGILKWVFMTEGYVRKL